MLGAFPKKATQGIATPSHLINRLRDRLKQARAIEARQGAES